MNHSTSQPGHAPISPEVVTYLEMTDPLQLAPSRPVCGLLLERIKPDSPLVPEIGARIGASYGWPHATRSRSDWVEWLSHPHRRYWLIRHESVIAGMADIEPHPGGEMEISTFGLLPEHVGKGLGGHALTLVIREAWEAGPLDAPTVRRVWLHTSSHDHPNALPNYKRRGLRPFRTEVHHRPDPA